MKHGKKYNEIAKLVDRTVAYEPEEAIALVKKTAAAKFDETVEVHIKTGCDGRHAEQQIRGAVVLPNGTGKTVRVLVFAKGDKLAEARRGLHRRRGAHPQDSEGRLAGLRRGGGHPRHDGRGRTPG